MISESEIIALIQAHFLGGADLTDDCGTLHRVPHTGKLLVTTDLMESGQHFDLKWHPPEFLGRKLLMVNLSDLDASGAKPLGFTLTLAVGRDVERDWLIRFLDGLADAAKNTRTPIIGGDTVGRATGLGLGITAFGAARHWLRRDGMQTGDRIYVDQPLGRSLRGLKKLQAGRRWNPTKPDADILAHLNPSPHLGLGQRLARIPQVHACIDLSDGLSKDLRMMAEASRRSVVLEKGLSPEAIQGGEDYARCFASNLPQARLEELLDAPLTLVGTVVEWGEAPLLHYHGRSLVPLPDQSFNHFAL